jgi:hypothetical protein
MELFLSNTDKKRAVAYANSTGVEFTHNQSFARESVMVISHMPVTMHSLKRG